MEPGGGSRMGKFRFEIWRNADCSLSGDYGDPGRGVPRPRIMVVYEVQESIISEKILAEILKRAACKVSSGPLGMW